MIKHLVVPLNLNNLKRDASKMIPNLNHHAKLLGDPLTEHRLFPIETIVISGLHPAKLVHNTSNLSSRPPSLDAIPKLMFNEFTCVWEAKHALLRNEGWHNADTQFINGDLFVPN